MYLSKKIAREFRLRNLLAISSLAFLPCCELSAQGDLRITEVNFDMERSNRGGEHWLETTVEVQVRGNSDPAAVNRRYLDDVRVYIALAFNLGSRSRTRLEYYWSEVEAATLDRGTHAFRFYLNPDLIKRNSLTDGEPYAFHIEVGAGSAAVANPVVAVSDNLRDPARLERFNDLLERVRDKQSGVLLPQAESPFRDMYLGETPATKGYRRSRE